MGQAAKKLKKVEASKQQPQLELVAINSHNPFWQSSLFSEVYLQNDVPVKYKELWDTDEAGPFYDFCNGFRNLCEELKDADMESWSERNTINRLIKPVLKMLCYAGTTSQEPWAEDEPFTIKEGGELKTYKPDLVIVNDPKELKYIERENGDKKLQEARSTVILPIEVKYWGRIEDVRLNNKEDAKRADKKEYADSARSFDFDEQCLKYMEILNKDYGVLTDGKTWRLFSRELSSDSYRRNFQFNLGNLIKHVNAGLKESHDYDIFIENAKYFFHLFSKQSLYSDNGEPRFVDELLEYSKKYASQIEEDLKERFVKAMAFACNGFLRSVESAQEKVNLATIRNVAESHLFNILFIKHCESRNILPLKQSPEYRKISVSNTIDKLEHFNPEREEDNLNLPVLKRMFSKDFVYTPDGTELYDRLLRLTKMVQEGTRTSSDGFEIKGFNETVFSRDELRFVKSHRLSNTEMVNILFELGYCSSDIPGKKYQQIPYNFFAPRQLGSIYESFLEFKIDRAKDDMAFLKRQWLSANLKSDKMRRLDVPKVRKGGLFFTPDNEERKATGSYYTPDCVVQFILRQTIGVQTAGKSSSEILKMQVCDPAMGSGHFLSGALNYLARIYLARLDEELNDDLNVSIVEAKQRVLHNCIYGVDINERAVKLAKMSLWMESASSNSSLESLDDQLKNGNSVQESRIWSDWGFLERGIDVVIGNPPYLGEKGHKETFRPISEGWLGRQFYQGKMDLLYFFFHLGIDILKTDGKLGFITTNYFPTASGATKLRSDLKDRTTLDLLMNLNEVKVFGEAAGQHNMITVLTKGASDRTCRTINTSEKAIVSEDLLVKLYEGHGASLQTLPANELFDGEECYIRLGATTSGGIDLKAIQSGLACIKKNSINLGEIVKVNQGIVSGADRVSEKHLKKFKLNAKKGDGIFVLTKDEVKALDLKLGSDKLLRPWFKNSDVLSFSVNEKPSQYVIYLDKREIDFQTLTGPLKRHVNKFYDVIENSVCSPPYLHRPRNPEIFVAEKIVAPQRSKLNVFGYNRGPWYASADVYFITKNDDSKVDLKFILGLLNSKLYFAWLYVMGKRKGEMLELYQNPLCEIPIPKVSEAAQKMIVALTSKLIKDPNDSVSFDKLNNEIFDSVGVSKSSRAAVEKLYCVRKAALSSEGDQDEYDDAA